MAARHSNTARGDKARAPEGRAPVRQHKYRVGQTVDYALGSVARMSRTVEKALSGSSFEISRLLPTAGTEFQYRVRNTTTGQERVVSENDITPAE